MGESIMNTLRICPGCGTPLEAGAPEGLCPRCLLKAGLGTATGNPTQDASRDARGAPAPPETIAKYFPQLEILELLGQGGMGTVYKARQPQLDRLVALKILPTELSRDAAFAERFTREARALAKLNHPNIVAIYDFGKAGDFYFFIMEYVDGLSLRQMEEAQKQLRPEEALSLIPKICEALQYAHEEGVVHRDIKPGNILLSKKGRVKIADFGLARIAGRESGDRRLTGSRDVMGTLHYMAPEQLEHPHAVDHRADIYSLGVVFYEMLTGELPIGRFATPSQKVQLDVRLDEIVLRALEKEPCRRYQHASEVKTDVETVASQLRPGQPQPHGSPGAPSQPESTPETNRAKQWVWAGVVAAILLVVGAIIVVDSHKRAPATALRIEAKQPSDSAAAFEQRKVDAERSLHLWIENLISSNGATYFNGVDSRPSTPDFRFDWGDGTSTRGFFPQTHTYANRTVDYVASVTAFYAGGVRDSAQALVRFTSGPNPVLADPANNLTGDTNRSFMDILQTTIRTEGDNYVFEALTAAPFPSASEMAGGKRFDFMWFVDIDKQRSTGQSDLGNDYNIHLFLDETGWHFAWYKVSPVSEHDGITIAEWDFRPRIERARAALIFPKRYLPARSFEMWATCSSLNAPKWPPLTENPPTARAEFNF
jgi:serine/threonine protein kinase